MKRIALFIALAAVLLLTLAAYTGTASAQSPQEIKVSEVEFALNPNTFTVQAGQPVQFTVTNNGKIVHNIKVELPSASIEKTLFDTNLQPGETRTATYTFSQAGQWEIYCPVGKHEDAGMKGTITVLAAAGAPAAAPTALPTTGGQFENNFAIVLLAGLLLLTGGFVVWELANAREV